MSQQFAYSQTKQNKAMTNEQFEQIVEAILAGKYSWACVLILRFAGYNPLHYIPYRTYNRLLKDNCLQSRSKPISQIKDLNYTEEVEREAATVAGGMSIFRNFWRF
ncbi:MAG: HetP family heterocyst commitment protein [Hydrococcus sp. RM1_1_31]|nr:HetP family heterocyst commitment protein [Hydrococcus sp. RM1_1_31]